MLDSLEAISPFETGYVSAHVKKYSIQPCLISQKSPLSKFVNSCLYGKLDGMQQYFSPKHLNKRSADGECALIKAAASTSSDSVEWLIKKKASVLVRCKNGLNALHVACAYGRLPMIKLFVSKGLDPLLCTVDTYHSPLHVALINDQPNCAFALLSYMKTVDLPDVYGVTPLHLAVLKNLSGLVIRMLSVGCNVNRQTLSLCCIQGIYSSNSQESPRYEQDILSKGISALHLASWLNNEEMILCLLQSGANPSLKDVNGKLPEHYCSDKKLKLTLQKCRFFYQDYTQIISE
eukprot:NODE_291_length_11621_cov_0.390557.p6 type:complete len:291 gc:universal NODE_291_length_11621_cov_0.390557:5906-5034(-)